MNATRLSIGVTALCTALAGPLGAQDDGASSRRLPHAVQQADNLAANMQDDIAAGRWDVAGKKLLVLRRLAPRLDSLEQVLEAQDRMQGREVNARVPAFVDALADRLADQRRLPALMSANAVGRALLPLVAAFSTTTQVAVTRLDVAGRDLQYAAERGSWNTAGQALDEIRTAYASLRPRLIRQAPNLNATVERRLSNLARALRNHLPVRTHSLAGEFIQDVDLIHSTVTADR